MVLDGVFLFNDTHTAAVFTELHCQLALMDIWRVIKGTYVVLLSGNGMTVRIKEKDSRIFESIQI